MAEVKKVQPEPAALDTASFRERLGRWYCDHARDLPWRNVDDPYATWLSEVMLQQTRVATVIERYTEFLKKFPTLQALAAAQENEVLALWSGLGYYRRARMLHRGARYVVEELNGIMPQAAEQLKTLPGVGDYTSAAIASIAFGERVAVLDGNVERVLLRVIGQPEEKTSAAKFHLQSLAQSLMPPRSVRGRNPAGDHNQAMMELGATVCLPRGPLCLQCPVLELCRTRGEHVTVKRGETKRRRVAHLLVQRKSGSEVLLERRSAEASLMAGMWELPPLGLDAVDGMTPAFQVKHSITDTVYEVDIFNDTQLRKEIPAAKSALEWIAVASLKDVPLTGLTRKVLVRMGVLAKRITYTSE